MKLSIAIGIVGLLATAGRVLAGSMHAGPGYTARAAANGVPAFPEVQILVEPPPGATADSIAQANFSLRVDGGSPLAAAGVETLLASGHGIAEIVTLDLSGSMTGGPLRALRAGLAKFVNQAAPQDRIAVQSVADDSRWDAEWTDTRDHLQDVLSKIHSRGHLTRLWDGLLEALGHFPDQPSARRLVVISDGHDEGSSHTEEEVIALALSNRIQIDSIGLTRSNPVYLKTLERLAAETGGHYQYAKTLEMLEQYVGDGIGRLHGLPVVTFRTANVAADGQAHNFEVTWKNGTVEASAATPMQTPVAPPSEAGPQDHDAATTQRWFEKIRPEWYAGGGLLVALLAGLAAWLIARNKRQRAEAEWAAASAYNMARAAEAFQSGHTLQPPQPAPEHLAYRPYEANAAVPAYEAPAVAAPGPLPPRTPTVIAANFPPPAKGQPSAWLYCEQGPEQGKSFPVEEEMFWIGANNNNHLRLEDDATVSGHHALIRYEDRVLGIHDHQSTNGTRVNDEVVSGTRRLLRPGDRIRVGRSIFVIRREQ